MELPDLYEEFRTKPGERIAEQAIDVENRVWTSIAEIEKVLDSGKLSITKSMLAKYVLEVLYAIMLRKLPDKYWKIDLENKKDNK